MSEENQENKKEGASHRRSNRRRPRRSKDNQERKRSDNPRENNSRNRNDNRNKNRNESKKHKRHDNRKKRPPRFTQRVSDHFSKRDFKCKDPDAGPAFRISLGLIGALELLRSKVNNRINIIKGYESAESQEKRKSYKKNYHTMGLAAVITVDNMDARDVFKHAYDIEEIKCLGLNLDDNTVYLDTRKEDERQMWVLEKDITTPIDDTNKATYLDL